MKEKKTVQSYHRAGYRNCMGWCNKQFYSIEKSLYTYCEACLKIKDKMERDNRRTSKLADNSLLSLED